MAQLVPKQSLGMLKIPTIVDADKLGEKVEAWTHLAPGGIKPPRIEFSEMWVVPEVSPRIHPQDQQLTLNLYEPVRA